MGVTTRSIVVAALILSLCGSSRQLAGQAADSPGILAVHVVDATTGAPVQGASVVVAQSGTPDISVARAIERPLGTPPLTQKSRNGNYTNQLGVVTLSVSPMTAVIRATAPGYLPGSYGQMWPLGPERPAAIASARSFDAIVRLSRFASISGHVYFPDGKPAAGVKVTALSRTDVVAKPGNPRFDSDAAVTSTNAAGEYTLGDLVPGKYTIAVLTDYQTIPSTIAKEYADESRRGEITRHLRSSNAPLPSGKGLLIDGYTVISPSGLTASISSTAASVFCTLFYPDSQDINSASVLLLRAAAKQTGVDFHLVQKTATHVSGRVFGPDGPVPHVGVRLSISPSLALSSVPLIGASTITDDNGRFLMVGVSPGDYVLAVTERTLPPRVDSEPVHATVNGIGIVQGTVYGLPRGMAAELPVRAAHLKLLLSGEGLDNITVVLRDSGRALGMLEFAGNGHSKPSGAALERAQFFLDPVQSHRTSVPIHVSPAGEIRSAPVLPGRYVITGEPVVGWMLEAARCNGQDGVSEALEFVGDVDCNVNIVLSRRVGRLSARLIRDNTAEGVFVFVFPANVADWRLPGEQRRRMRLTYTTDARIRATGMPYGDYFVVAIANASLDMDWREPEELEKLATYASRITVGDGDRELEVPVQDLHR